MIENRYSKLETIYECIKNKGESRVESKVTEYQISRFDRVSESQQGLPKYVGDHILTILT